MLMILGLGLLTIVTTPFQFPPWKYPSQFFWSCIIPIVPFILTADGIVSSLRTRTAEEVVSLLKNCGAEIDFDDLEVRSGRIQHTKLVGGYLSWTIITKKSAR